MLETIFYSLGIVALWYFLLLFVAGIIVIIRIRTGVTNFKKTSLLKQSLF